MENFETKIGYSKTGSKLGQVLFQGFLLAGERYLTAGMNRKGTFESSFEKFYSKLGDKSQEVIKGYFLKQSKLDLSQRALILGDIVKVDIRTPLTLATLAPKQVFEFLQTFKKTKKSAAIPNCKAKLSLTLDSVKVIDSQDEYYYWAPSGLNIFKKWKKVWRNQSDEVVIGLVGIDNTAEVSYNSVDLGSIREGTTGGFQKNLIEFDACKAGDDFPKIFSAIMLFYEKDTGDYSNLLERYVQFAKDEIDEELIEEGLQGASQNSIPEDTMDALASLLKDTFDAFVGWLGDLLRNNDEVMGEITRKCTIINSTNNWQSPVREKRIRKHDGTWLVKYYWKKEV